MNQWVKSLLCKHENPHKKMSLTAGTCSLELEGTRGRSEAYLLVSLAEWQAPGLGSVRDLLQRKKLSINLSSIQVCSWTSVSVHTGTHPRGGGGSLHSLGHSWNLGPVKIFLPLPPQKVEVAVATGTHQPVYYFCLTLLTILFILATIMYYFYCLQVFLSP